MNCETQIEEHVSGLRKNRFVLPLDCLQLADDTPDAQLHISVVDRLRFRFVNQRGPEAMAMPGTR